ncbi:S9 family peptidase [Sandaracinobacter sp. RS1-74]|uniref:S9 family peptidase n=1 Tax=Sandaracinobacteroides sayramensis TaxID=2913411 RepID=UPI001EDABF46|nr:S9 family peptidase [Sandaracinobacteroides sayramensis]MCG2842803.1 S9 family peptidase [Sandaracinobacteroides sayramensis]
MKILIAALLAASSLPIATQVVAQEAKPFQPADIYDLQMVTQPVVSPDGSRILFTRGAFDRGTDRRASELWLAHVDAAGKIIDRRLLVGRDVSPRQARFSPDGSRIVYVAQYLGKPQLHVMALAEAVGKPLTSGNLSPVGPVWSPDGKRIAFAGRVEAKPASIPGMPEKPTGMGVEAAADAKIVSDLFWRADGAGEIKPGATHLFVADAATGAVSQLTSGDTDRINDNGGLDWTRDGRAIVGAFTADPINGPREVDLYLYDAHVAAGGQPKPPTRLTSRPGSETAPQVSPDGRSVAFVGAEASGEFYDMPELWTTGIAPGSPINHLSKALDRPIAGFGWDDDGRSLHILYHDEGTQRLARIDAASGATRVMIPSVGGTRLYLPSASGQADCAGGTCAWTTAFTDRPTGLGVSKGAAETDGLDFNAQWAAARKPARIAEITVASRADGRRVQGWIAYPPDFNPARRYPIILDIHGGPNTDYGPFFSVTHSLYAAAGYLVLYTNPRGSIGYGREFANLITNAYPGQDHDDLMTMVDALAARPYADAKNLFIGGGSGGGVLTLWAIGKEPDKFRAAVALRPVVDWTDQVTTSDGTAFFMKHWMGATPWDKPDLYFQRSPFSLSGEIKTPTLLITGENDYRTPISQTEQMFGALKLRGVEAEMIRLPGAGHGMGRPSQWLQSILAPIDWFNQRKAK